MFNGLEREVRVKRLGVRVERVKRGIEEYRKVKKGIERFFPLFRMASLTVNR